MHALAAGGRWRGGRGDCDQLFPPPPASAFAHHVADRATGAAHGTAATAATAATASSKKGECKGLGSLKPVELCQGRSTGSQLTKSVTLSERVHS